MYLVLEINKHAFPIGTTHSDEHRAMHCTHIGCIESVAPMARVPQQTDITRVSLMKTVFFFHHQFALVCVDGRNRLHTLQFARHVRVWECGYVCCVWAQKMTRPAMPATTSNALSICLPDAHAVITLTCYPNIQL